MTELKTILEDLDENRFDFNDSAALTKIGRALENILLHIFTICHEKLSGPSKKNLLQEERKIIDGRNITYHNFTFYERIKYWDNADIPGKWAKIIGKEYPPNVFNQFPFHEIRKYRNDQSHGYAYPNSLETTKRLFYSVKELLKAVMPLKDQEEKAVMPRKDQEEKKVVSNLPQKNHFFIGRNQEIKQIFEWLSKNNRCMWISISGVGGYGKSALALEVATRCLERNLPKELDNNDLYFDAYIWTSAKKRALIGDSITERFHVQANLEEIIAEIIRVLKPEQAKEMPDFDIQKNLAMQLLKDYRILLIIDNMETINDSRVMSFLSELPGESKGIATDRRAIQAFNSISLPPLSNEESKKLILEYCYENDNIKLSDTDIKIIIKNTNGIPLAIHWVLSQIATRKLDTEGLFKNFSNKHGVKLLDYIFNTSYAQLESQTQHMLTVISLINAKVDVNILSKIFNLDPGIVEDDLLKLDTVNLIFKIDNQNNSSYLNLKFEVLPMTREFIQSVVDKQELDNIRQNIHNNILVLLKKIDDNPEWPSIALMNIIEEYREIFIWAVEDSFDHQNFDNVIELVKYTGSSLGHRGFHDLRIRISELAIESCKKTGNIDEWARNLITNLGWVYFSSWHQYDKCETVVNDGLSMARDIGNNYLEGMALRLLGLVAKERGMLDRAEDFLKKAESVLSQKNDPYLLAITYGALGSLYRETKNYDLSEKYLNQALKTSSNLTNGQEITSVFLSKLTKLYIYKADQKSLVRAEELNKKALSISRQLNRQIGTAYCKLNYGLIAKKRNDNEKALSYADEAEGLFVRYGSKEDIARELKYLRSED